MNLHAFRRPLAAMLTAALVLLTALPAQAALNAYLTIKGGKQGQIQGSVTQKGREGMIQVFSTEHVVKVPIDAATGMVTGKRQHGQFIVRKEVDRSSPLLYQALVANETLTEVVLKFFTPDPSGTGMEINHYTVKLTNARLSAIKLVQPNTRVPDLAKLPLQEEISFTYQHIEWTWVKDGATAVDELAPAAN